MIAIAGNRVSAGAGAVPRGQAAVRGWQQAGVPRQECDLRDGRGRGVGAH